MEWRQAGKTGQKMTTLFLLHREEAATRTGTDRDKTGGQAGKAGRRQGAGGGGRRRTGDLTSGILQFGQAFFTSCLPAFLHTSPVPVCKQHHLPPVFLLPYPTMPPSLCRHPLPPFATCKKQPVWPQLSLSSLLLSNLSIPDHPSCRLFSTSRLKYGK